MRTIASQVGAHKWDPSRFLLIRRSPWLDSIKRGLRLRGCQHGDRLFLYITRSNGKAVLGYWVKGFPRSGERAFVTLIAMPCPPDMAPWLAPNLAYVSARIRPVREQAVVGLKALKEEEYEEVRARDEEEDAKAQYLKFVGKRDEALARKVRMGMIPVSFKKDGRYDEAVERMTARLLNKIIVTKD